MSVAFDVPDTLRLLSVLGCVKSDDAGLWLSRLLLLNPRILLGGGSGGGAPGDAVPVKLVDVRLALEGVLDGVSAGG
jgi:hypothetical protein